MDKLIRKVIVIKKTTGLCNAPCVVNIVLKFRSANLKLSQFIVYENSFLISFELEVLQ